MTGHRNRIYKTHPRFLNLMADMKADVLRQINRPVVWYDEDRDITEAILQRLIDKPEKDQPAAENPTTP